MNYFLQNVLTIEFNSKSKSFIKQIQPTIKVIKNNETQKSKGFF